MPSSARLAMQAGRGLRAALVVVLAMGMAASLAQTPPRLLVWINGDKGYNGLQKVGDAFAKESGVQVVVQHPEGAPDKFQAAAAAGKGPDIMCWPHDRVGEWAKSGLIVPVRPNQRIRAARRMTIVDHEEARSDCANAWDGVELVPIIASGALLGAVVFGAGASPRFDVSRGDVGDARFVETTEAQPEDESEDYECDE